MVDVEGGRWMWKGGWWMWGRAERFPHYPFFRVHVSFIIKIRGSGTGPGYPTGPVFCAVVADNSRYISSEGILAMTGRDKLHFHLA